MKLTAQADALAAASKAAVGAVDAKTAKRIPVLGALLIDARENACKFVGTDLDVMIAGDCDAVTAKTGRAAVSAEALTKLLVGIAPDAEVAIETVAGGMQVKAGRSRYQLPALPAEDFPAAPVTTSTTEIVLTHDEVRHLFGSTVFCVNTEDARSYLKGTYFHLDGKHLCAAATNGHRLALASTAIIPAPVALPANGEGTGIIIPSKTVALINKLKATEIKLRTDNKVVEIRAHNLLISSKLIAGTFPDYRRIIPAQSSNTAKLEREALFAALKRLSAVRDVAEQAINMSLAWKTATTPSGSRSPMDISARTSLPLPPLAPRRSQFRSRRCGQWRKRSKPSGYSSVSPTNTNPCASPAVRTFSPCWRHVPNKNRRRRTREHKQKDRQIKHLLQPK